MTMTLQDAIAEVRRVTPANDPWCADDFEDGPTGAPENPTHAAMAVVLQAAVSGDLIPKTDAAAEVARLREALVEAREAIAEVLGEKNAG